MIYIATVWIEPAVRHEVTDPISFRRLVERGPYVSAMHFRAEVESFYRRHYEAGLYDITIGPVSESRLRQ